jgi:hypothetical protein
MGIAALILGVLGLLAICIGLPLLQPAVFLGGSGAALAAFIIGFIGRGTGGPAKAGMVLGLLGVLGSAGVYFLFIGTHEVQVAQPRATSVPASVPAAVPPAS